VYKIHLHFVVNEVAEIVQYYPRNSVYCSLYSCSVRGNILSLGWGTLGPRTPSDYVNAGLLSFRASVAIKMHYNVMELPDKNSGLYAHDNCII